MEQKKKKKKELLLKDLCARVPYGVKIMVEGWDSDMDCEFTTIETLIGIDDRFIHTIWDKTGDKDKHSIIEPLSIIDYKPYLRPMSSMTEEEAIVYRTTCYYSREEEFYFAGIETFDYLLKKHFDYRGLIPMNLALEAPTGMYNI